MSEQGDTIEPNKVHHREEEKTIQIKIPLSKLVIGATAVVTGGLLLKKFFGKKKTQSPQDKIMDLQLMKMTMDLEQSMQQNKQVSTPNTNQVEAMVKKMVKEELSAKKS